MKTNYIHPLFILTLFTMCLFISCRSDEVQAMISLEGNWNITKKTTFYGEFSPTSFNATETINSAGGGGFHFSENLVEYTLSKDSTIYIGTGTWNLELEKVRDSFFRRNEFTLTIEDRYVFDVSFEDGTVNAEKDATRAILMEVPTEETDVLIMLRLQKW